MCSNPESLKIVLETLIHGLNISQSHLLSLLTYQAPTSNLLLAPPIGPGYSPALPTGTGYSPAPILPRPPMKPLPFHPSPWFPHKAFFISLVALAHISVVVVTYTYVYVRGDNGMDDIDEMNSDEHSMDEINSDEYSIQNEYEGPISHHEEMELAWFDEDTILDDDEERPPRDDDDAIQGEDEDSIQDHEENPPQDHERGPIQHHEEHPSQHHERWHRGRQRTRESGAGQEDSILVWRANVS